MHLEDLNQTRKINFHNTKNKSNIDIIKRGSAIVIKAIEDLIVREIHLCTPQELLYVFHSYRLSHKVRVEDLVVKQMVERKDELLSI